MQLNEPQQKRLTFVTFQNIHKMKVYYKTQHFYEVPGV